MTRAAIVLVLLLVGVPTFFAWAGWATRRRHAGFTNQDVQAVFELALRPADNYDDWDLFLAWPIDDPYLESLRKRCVQIWDDCGQVPCDQFVTRLKPILEELKRRPS